MFLHVFFCNIFCFFIILIRLISAILCITSLYFLYAHVSINSIDYFILSSLALNEILLTSSVNT